MSDDQERSRPRIVEEMLSKSTKSYCEDCHVPYDIVAPDPGHRFLHKNILAWGGEYHVLGHVVQVGMDEMLICNVTWLVGGLDETANFGPLMRGGINERTRVQMEYLGRESVDLVSRTRSILLWDHPLPEEDRRP